MSKHPNEEFDLRVAGQGDEQQEPRNHDREKDVLDHLVEDARRLRVARKLPKGKLRAESILQVQGDFESFIEESGLSVNEIARQMGNGFSAATLSMFRAWKNDGNSFGDVERVVRGLNQYFETWRRKQEVPRPEGWIETEVAKRMLTLISNTIEFRTMGLIYSDAGRGKTMTITAAMQIYTGTIGLRVRRSTRTPLGLAKQIAKQLKIKGSSLFTLEERIIDRLKGTERAIMIDEAQQLTDPALEFVRDLHDECEIPIILVGTHKVLENVDDAEQFFGQLSSRCSLMYDVTEKHRSDGKGGRKSKPKPLHSAEEIRRIWESDKLRLDKDALQLLAKIANVLGGGGLREVKMLVLKAARIAKGSHIDEKNIRQAMRASRGDNLAYRQHDRAEGKEAVA